MTGSSYIYCMLGDLVFGEWPLSDIKSLGIISRLSLLLLIRYYPEWGTAFDVYMDNHNGLV